MYKAKEAVVSMAEDTAITTEKRKTISAELGPHTYRHGLPSKTPLWLRIMSHNSGFCDSGYTVQGDYHVDYESTQ